MKKRMTFKQFLFILPLLVLIFVFSVYPIVTSVIYSFFDYRINDQQHNDYYLGDYFNAKLFCEDCDYIVFFLNDEITVVDEDGKAEFFSIQNKVSEMSEQFEGKGSKEQITDEQADEIDAFISSIMEEIDSVYQRYPEAEFYNKEKIPQIIEEMNTCMIHSNFAGVGQYAKLVGDSRFWADTGHTVIFTVISVSVELVLGMLLALIMNKAIRGVGIVRTVGLIPWAIPTAVSAMMWRYLYDGSSGVVAYIFSKIGLISSQEVLLTSGVGAMASALIADIWKTTPYMALLLLAGLQVIDRGLYESAAIDGANGVKAFFKITLPLMRPSILIALLFRTLDAFRVYDLIAVLTGGGPGGQTETLSVYAYKTMFGQSNYGYGSTIIVGMFVFVAIIAFVYVKVLGADVLGDEEG